MELVYRGILMKSFAKLKDLAFSHKNYTTIFMAKSIETEKRLK